MNIQDLLAYLQRSNTNILGYLPNMYGGKVSPTPVPDSDSADYDMVGWELKNGGKRLGPLGGHFTDEFKLPNHPTFSNESIYSNPLLQGGKWYQNGLAFDPSQYNEQTNGLKGIVDYLKVADPNTQLLEKQVPNYRQQLESLIHQSKEPKMLTSDVFSRIIKFNNKSLLDKIKEVYKPTTKSTINNVSGAYTDLFGNVNTPKLKSNMYDDSRYAGKIGDEYTRQLQKLLQDITSY